jgi:hypothetical protein
LMIGLDTSTILTVANSVVYALDVVHSHQFCFDDKVINLG